MKMERFVTGCLLAGLLAGCGSASAPRTGAAGQGPPSPSASASPGATSLPATWRWESYQGVEVGVPGSWGYGTTDEPWCLSQRDGADRRPYVGRPGPVAAIGCLSTNDGKDPGRLVKIAGTFVWLGRPDDAGAADQAREDRQTVTMDGVAVDVQAPAALRHQIVATIHRVTVDHHGCAAEDRAVRAHGWRPAAGVPVGQLTGVSSVAACKYGMADGQLAGSVGLTGAAAADAMDAVGAAPAGGGPNDPGSCAKDVAYGDQLIVLIVQADQGRQQVALRFDGCDHHGFDDGHTVRALTRAAVAPFVVGSNQVLSWNGALGGVLSPHN